MTQIAANFPKKLECLFEPKRYKILYGGRGAGRSWGVARALLIQGTQKPLRVLCAREFQNSISDSVHKLLSDQIEALGLAAFYKVLQSRIEGVNGTYFAFEGIKNNTNRIKSYEGIDVCWVEEANKVTKSSWGILIPTIRREASEIWMTFNPELETDYTYKRFVTDRDDSMAVVRMTYRDNPWFPDVLRDEMERDKARDYDYYLHVWEGLCVQQLEGAIYAKQLRRMQEDGRICRVPWVSDVAVSTHWDLGRADRTAIWFAQRVAMQWRLIDYLEGSNEDLPFYLKELQRKSYFYEKVWLPHDAKHKRMGMPKTLFRISLDMGFPTEITPNIPRVEGINAARMIMSSCWIDERNCQEGLQRLKHYRYRVVDGHLSNEPLHDDASDGADAFRYFAVNAKSPSTSNDTIKNRLANAAAALRGESMMNEGTEFSGRSGRSQGWMS